MATRAEDPRREALALADAQAFVTASAWAEEIEGRACRVLAGDADTTSWSTVRQRLASALDG